MDGVIGFSNYKQYKESLDQELSRSAESFVRIGYLLKVARDTNILYESGYETVTQFAEAEYNLRPDQVTRFMQINDRYSEGGYGETLQDAYKGMGYTKLVEMLQLPMVIAQELTPDFTREEIKEIRSEVEEEQKITDLEVMMEPKDWDGEISVLQQVIIQLGHDNQEWYKKVYDWAQGEKDLQKFKWLMDPNGSTLYSVRIRGLGKFLLSVKEKEEQAVLINVRTNEKEQVAWDTIMHLSSDLIESGTLQEYWQQVYGEEMEEEPPAPVNTGSGWGKPKKKEKKVVVVKKTEKKKRDQNALKRDQNTLKHQDQEKGKENEPEEHRSDSEGNGAETVSQSEEKPVGEDGKTDEIAPEQPEERSVGTRKQFLDSLTEYGAAEIIAGHIRKVMETAEQQDLGSYKHWEKWLSEDVDVLGNTWEYEEEI